ncbi:hypothetical protein TDB9533_03036 [Thalassocella blandensis]|nr:hypothetical protein TDB9533_03036 [Thalassocella blandensis]
MRNLVWLVSLVSTLLLASCGGGGSNNNGYGNGGGGGNSNNGIEINDHSFVGASASGNKIYLGLNVTLDEVNANTNFIKLLLEDDEGNEVGGSSVPVVEGTNEYHISAGVGSTVNAVTASVYVTKTSEQTINDTKIKASVEVSTDFRSRQQDFSQVSSVELSVVDDSYESELVGGRRIHRFAVKVFDQNNNSISGLEADTSNFFTIYEDGVVDVESGVELDTRQSQVKVYLVLDVSSSITQANQQSSVLDAASKAVVSLSQYATFDYREFSGDYREIESLLDLSFETANSATALYYTIDNLLDEINSNESSVIIAFTDGRDLASRNYYPEAASHNAVRDMVANKISSTRTELSQDALAGSLTSYFIGLGSDIDTESLQLLANSGGTESLFATDEEDLAEVFITVANIIQDTYNLEYNSQQTPDDTSLQLSVEVNGIVDTVVIK